MYPNYYMMRDYGHQGHHSHHPHQYPGHQHGGVGNFPVIPFLAGLAGGGLLYSAFSGPWASPYGPTPYGSVPFGASPYYGSGPYGPHPYGRPHSYPGHFPYWQ
ncbi:hypothetical protein RJD24_15035 [Bacillaceae bacterium IKA-2]|nr:hypothetical protein RJD24_15035 [Bacillaceae bacterium IKA-2]